MSSLLNRPWFDRFREEMEAIGCKFSRSVSVFDDDEIQVPISRMDEAKQIIAKYSTPEMRK